MNLQPGPDETLDHLAGDWKIFQLAKGHRFSTDDMVTAWRASENAPQTQRMLDLGSGIGSVGLLTLARLGPDATLVGLEAQDISVALARRTAALNGLQDRVTFHHGDIRHANLIDESFSLITGSPPYVPPDKGVHSPHPQRAACRMELRGSVYDYCAAARRWLAPGGLFCFVMAAQDPRTEDAPREHGLAVIERWDYVFRAGRDPHITTLLCAREEDGPHPPRRTGLLKVRGEDGAWTPEYLAFRAQMGARLVV